MDGVATFRIVAGPASSTAPKGLPLFKATTYVVRCSQRQLNRGRAGDGDKSDLVIEGYQKPRVDENGKPYIAVIATSVASKNLQAGRKLEQLREDAGKAEDAYNAACDQYGEDSAQATAPNAPATDSHLTELSKFRGVEFVLSVSSSDPGQFEAWGLDEAGPLATWTQNTMQGFRALGETLQAGILNRVEAEGPMQKITAASRKEEDLCAGFYRSLPTETMRETMQTMLSKWAS